MTKQGLLPYHIDNVSCADGYIAPFEYQHSVRFEDSHTFLKAFADHRFPISIKRPVLFSHPRQLCKVLYVRRVKHYQRETVVFKRQSCEVALYVGIDYKMTVFLFAVGVENLSEVALPFLSAFVAVDSVRFVLLKPYRPVSAGNIEYLLFRKCLAFYSTAFMLFFVPFSMIRGVSNELGLNEAISPYPPHSKDDEVLTNRRSTFDTVQCRVFTL